MIVLRNKLFAKFKLNQADVKEILPQLRKEVSKVRKVKPQFAFHPERIYNTAGKDIRKWTYEWKPNSSENEALRYLRQNYTRDASGKIVKKSVGSSVKGGMMPPSKVAASPL